jgi:hypothetical protein
MGVFAARIIHVGVCSADVTICETPFNQGLVKKAFHTGLALLDESFKALFKPMLFSQYF